MTPLLASGSTVIQAMIDSISLGCLYALFALGIALIFGVMGLINFAHGELVMIGAFAAVYLSGIGQPWLALGIVGCVVVAAVLMERVAFRPLRGAAPATILVASFGVSIVLQNAAQMAFGSLPKSTNLLSGLSTAYVVGDVSIPKLAVATVAITVVLVAALVAFLRFTDLGIQMRAAAENFPMARLMGVRANRVIATAFAISGVLAAAAAIILVSQTGSVTTTMGVNVVVVAFVATILGGAGQPAGRGARRPTGRHPDRRPPGHASAGAPPVPRRVRLRACAGGARRPSAGPDRVRLPTAEGLVAGHVGRLQVIGRQLSTPLVLSALVVGVAEFVTLGGPTLERIAVMMVINLIVVVGLYVFVGISGVFSFGQVSFMAIGAYTTAILSIPTDTKDVIFTSMPPALRHAHLGSLGAVLAGGVVAALVALVFALPLSRLSGLVAGLGTFAFLLIVNVVASAWTAVTNGTTGMSAIPVTTTLTRTLIFAVAAILVAFAYQTSRFGRRLRTSREDEVASRAVGVNVGIERSLSFVISALIVGIAGGLYAAYLGNIDPSAFFLNTTFLTIAMLVVGGMTTLSGAVIGTIFISAVAELLRRVEAGFHLGSTFVHAPAGLQEVGLGLLMLAVLIWRPQGLTNGRELRLPARRSRASRAEHRRTSCHAVRRADDPRTCEVSTVDFIDTPG